MRTLVAMATYSFHKLIMGKMGIVSLGIIDFIFTEMFIEEFFAFHKTFVGIA